MSMQIRLSVGCSYGENFGALCKVMKVNLWVSVIALFFAHAAIAQSYNAIQSVSGSIQGGTEIIRIELSEPLSVVPFGFSIQTPARIALDFPGVTNSIGRSSVELSLGNLRSANVIQAGERTRFVLNLRTATVY